MTLQARGVGGKVHAVALLSGVADEFGQGLERQILVGDHDQAGACELGQRRQVLERVETDFLGQGRLAQCSVLNHQKGVAAFAMGLEVLDADGPRGTGLGFHDHGLLELLLHALCQQTGQGVSCATGRPGDDQAYGPGRPVRGLFGLCGQGQAGGHGHDGQA